MPIKIVSPRNGSNRLACADVAIRSEQNDASLVSSVDLVTAADKARM